MLKSAVMGSYLVLAFNAYIANANFHYTGCGVAKSYRSVVNEIS